MDNKITKEQKTSWKECIIFGVINILLVLLCTKLVIVLISVGMILLLILGFGFSIQSIKEDWNAGFKVSVIGCIVGLILNCFAAFLYVTNILTALIKLLLRFFV